MIFNSIVREEGCNCAGCGQSQYEGLSTPILRKDGKWDLLTVCSGCLFKAAIGEAAFNKALGVTDEPKPIPSPEQIKPRLFG